MNKPDQNPKSVFVYLLLFAVAMGFMEAIIVLYIREISYPEGFVFPLNPLPTSLMKAELIRELSTMVMLLTVAWLTGKTFLRRLNAFLFLFGIWDIFYYVALRLFLDWPESLLTWDILFLIPVIWIGPVLAPLICSVTMILMAICFEWLKTKNKITSLRWYELMIIFTGAIIIYITFTYDFSMIILKGNYLSELLSLAENTQFNKILTNYIPEKFKWGTFTVGITIIVFASILVFLRSFNKYNRKKQ
jgi:hypothetical protein